MSSERLARLGAAFCEQSDNDIGKELYGAVEEKDWTAVLFVLERRGWLSGAVAYRMLVNEERTDIVAELLRRWLKVMPANAVEKIARHARERGKQWVLRLLKILDGSRHCANNSDGESGNNSDGESAHNSDGESADNSDAESGKNSDGESARNSDGESADNSDGESGRNSDDFAELCARGDIRGVVRRLGRVDDSDAVLEGLTKAIQNGHDGTAILLMKKMQEYPSVVLEKLIESGAEALWWYVKHVGLKSASDAEKRAILDKAVQQQKRGVVETVGEV